MHFTDEFGVIRHHGKIQRSSQLQGALRPAIFGPWLNTDTLAKGELVGLCRRGACALGGGIQRVARMDVQVTEKRLLQGCTVVQGSRVSE